MVEVSPTSFEDALAELQGLLSEALEKADKWDAMWAGYYAASNARNKVRYETDPAYREHKRMLARDWYARVGKQREREAAQVARDALGLVCVRCGNLIPSPKHSDAMYCSRSCKEKGRTRKRVNGILTDGPRKPGCEVRYHGRGRSKTTVDSSSP